MIRAFTPDEVLSAKAERIPPFVIEAVNELLVTRFLDRRCVLTQNEIIERAKEIGEARGTFPPDATESTFYDQHWLDFEPIFRQAGWSVEYDSPAWDDNYEARFVFSRRKTSLPG